MASWTPSASSASPDPAGRVLPPEADRIAIDREGNFLHEGVVITHPGTVALFFRALEPDGRGGWRLRLGRETCPVDVEDAPLVVRSIEATPDALTLILSDGSREPLDPATLRQRADHVVTCAVKGGAFPARFSRPAYYMLAELLEPDGGGYLLAVGGRAVRVLVPAG